MFEGGIRPCQASAADAEPYFDDIPDPWLRQDLWSVRKRPVRLKCRNLAAPRAARGIGHWSVKISPEALGQRSVENKVPAA